MNSEQVGGILRVALSWAAGWVPAAYMSGDDYTQIAGAAVGLAVAIWTWYAHKKPVA